MIYLLYCVRKKILCDIRSCRRVKKREKYIGCSFANGKQRNMREEQEQDSTRWEMAVWPRPSRSFEFSMEFANDKIRARLFRHTKFQNVSARLRSSYSGRVPPLSHRSLPQRALSDVNVVRGIYPSSSSSWYLIFMKDSESQTHSRRKTVREETTVYRGQRKKGKLGRKGFNGESDFKALSPINCPFER